MSDDILYFVQWQSDADSGDFFFGNAHECAHWYLTFEGADYRVAPVPGKSQTWGIQFKQRVGKPYCATRFTVDAATEAGALAAVRQEVLDKLLSHATPAATNCSLCVGLKKPWCRN